MNIRTLLLPALCLCTSCALLSPAPAWAAKTAKETSADLRKKEAQQKKWEANREKNVKKNALAKQRQNLETMHKIITVLKSIRTPEQAKEKCDELWQLSTEKDTAEQAYYDYTHAPAALKKDYYLTRREYIAQRHRLVESGIVDAAGRDFDRRLQYCGTRWTDDRGSFDWPRCTWQETLAKRQAGTEEEIDKQWLKKNSEANLTAGLQCSLEAYRKCLEILRGIKSHEDAVTQKHAVWDAFKESWKGVCFMDHAEIPEPYLSEYIDVKDESLIEFYRICKEGYLADDPRFDEATPYLNYLNSAFGHEEIQGAWVEEFHNYPPGQKALRAPAPPPTRTIKDKKKKKNKV